MVASLIDGVSGVFIGSTRSVASSAAQAAITARRHQKMAAKSWRWSEHWDIDHALDGDGARGLAKEEQAHVKDSSVHVDVRDRQVSRPHFTSVHMLHNSSCIAVAIDPPLHRTKP